MPVNNSDIVVKGSNDKEFLYQVSNVPAVLQDTANYDTTTNITQQQKLFASDATSGNRFGEAVAVDGDYAIIGASRKGPGAAYIFVYANSTWTEQASLRASDGTADDFGISVDIAGEYAIVGCWRDTELADKAGSAHIFVRSGTTWSKQAKLLPRDPAASDYF